MCYGFSVSAEKKKQFRTRTKQLIGCSKKTDWDVPESSHPTLLKQSPQWHGHSLQVVENLH